MEISLINAFSALADDIDLDPFTKNYCIQRLKSEGYKFLSVTLPKLVKSVLASLELGYFDRPTDFAWKRKSLRYFTKFLNKLFDPKTGLVLKEPDPLALLQLRHLCEYFYKLSLPFTTEEIEKSTEAFLKTDAAVPSICDDTLDIEYVEDLRKDFETYFAECASATVDDILHQKRPRSGPGTFSGKKAYEQTHNQKWFIRKEVDYSVDPKFYNVAYASRPMPSAPFPTLCGTDPDFSEVLFVPKDSRGPRTIVREPYALLRYQMAFNAYLSNELEHATRHRINFREQGINRCLARQSSIDRSYVTLDLKNASDSVSFEIVSRIFRNAPGLRYFVSRSTRSTRLPSGRSYTLRKLSGMGSGLTFPTMSLLIYLAICHEISRYIPYRTAMRFVYVYGDDIIVPKRFYSDALRALARVGLHVNKGKSYIHSHFRESCGGDYFHGQDVAPARLKLSSTDNRIKDGHTLTVNGPLSFLAIERHCRELVHHGLLSLAEYYYTLLEKRLGRLPKVAGESPVLGRFCLNTPDYPVTDDGAYAPVRAIVPVPDVVEGDRDPYIYLQQKLSGDSPSWSNDLFGSSFRSQFDEVNVPRSVKYRRLRVSAFRLMG